MRSSVPELPSMDSIFLNNVELDGGLVANEALAADPLPLPVLVIAPVMPCMGLVNGAMFSYSSSL